MNFKHGKFGNSASKTHGFVSPEAPTSVVTKDTSTEAPTNTTNTVSYPCFYHLVTLYQLTSQSFLSSLLT